MRRTCKPCWPSRCIEVVVLLTLGLSLGGCASLGPKPWEHDLMAEPAMSVNAYPLQSAIDDHIYFSKEASSGGRSYAGGGCGCK
jgi:Domain of unknown function (DUF4266)